MNPSRFRNRIELFQRITSTDNLLQDIETFNSLGKIWADIKTVRGNEYFNASQEKQNKNSRFIVRYSRSLETLIQNDKTSFEIEFKGSRYDVRDVYNDNERNITITIVAEARL